LKAVAHCDVRIAKFESPRHLSNYLNYYINITSLIICRCSVNSVKCPCWQTKASQPHHCQSEDKYNTNNTNSHTVEHEQLFFKILHFSYHFRFHSLLSFFKQFLFFECEPAMPLVLHVNNVLGICIRFYELLEFFWILCLSSQTSQLLWYNTVMLFLMNT
jgi:hypothetical protein